jgi:predicted RNA-binding protein (virulence factor B family)
MNTQIKNTSINIGEINTLEVMRDTDYGYFLEAKDDSEVLLPNVYVMEDEMPMGSLIDVFVYTDSEDRPVSSTKLPYAKLGEYGFFTVVDYKPYGAFVNWGLPKDLFVPLSQQKEHFTIGKKYLLRVCLDAQSNRLFATQKIGKYLNRDMKGLHQNKVFEAIVLAKTPLGYKVIADNQYEGMLFNNEIFEPLRIGDKKTVYIKSVRKDFKLDLSLQVIGKQGQISQTESKIITLLKEANGSLEFTYKSDADAIKEVFNMSKKNFKRTLTVLIENKMIALEAKRIVLL